MTLDLSTRAGLGRAITLIESRRADHQAEARALLADIMPRTGVAQRIGITGVPGVGKSTFIESFGTMLTALYTMLYALLRSEDHSLLLGALLVFGVLAAVMLLTRRIDWYRVGPLTVPSEQANRQMSV